MSSSIKLLVFLARRFTFGVAEMVIKQTSSWLSYIREECRSRFQSCRVESREVSVVLWAVDEQTKGCMQSILTYRG